MPAEARAKAGMRVSVVPNLMTSGVDSACNFRVALYVGAALEECGGNVFLRQVVQQIKGAGTGAVVEGKCDGAAAARAFVNG